MVRVALPTHAQLPPHSRLTPYAAVVNALRVAAVAVAAVGAVKRMDCNLEASLCH